MPSRGPLERRLWCQFRISSDQLIDGVHGVVVLGNLTGVVEVREALKSVQGALEIVGLTRGRRALVERPRPPEDADERRIAVRGVSGPRR